MGKAKRLLAGILAAVVAFSSDGIIMAANSGVSELGQDKVIEISSVKKLMKVADDLSGNYCLTKDLDLSDVEWETLGSKKEPFTGTFDGNGHVISHLEVKITEKDDSYIGLFGIADGAKITNLTLEDMSIWGQDTERIYVGTLVGKMINSEVTDCHVSGNIVLEDTNVYTIGGLAGAALINSDEINGECKVSGCDADIKVLINENDYGGTAGLVGYIQKGVELESNISYQEEIPLVGELADSANVKILSKKNSNPYKLNDQKSTTTDSNDLVSADGIYFYTIDEDNLSITGYQGTGNELIIPDTIDGYKVIAIKRGAFAGHSELTSIMLPESLMSIGPHSFSGTSIRTITIPKNVNRNGEDGYVSTSGSLNGATDLTEVIFQDGITKIPDYICASCNNVTKIVIPSSVTEIGNYAFRNCSMLSSIELPKELNTIGEGAFCECEKLNNVELPDSVLSIGSQAFYRCKEINSITLPKNLASMGYSVFSGTQISSITIPKTLEKCKYHHEWLPSRGNVDKGPLSDANNLAEVIFEDGSEKIADYICLGVGKLTAVALPDTVRSIGNRSFFKCSLKEIDLPDNITEIGGFAFFGCPLSSIILPPNLEFLGGFAIGWTDISSIFIPKSLKRCSYGWYDGWVPSEGGALADAWNLKEVIFEDGITKIPDYICAGGLYTNCSIENLTIPDSVTEIGKHAFSNCDNLKKVDIPESVTNIGEQAFANCAELTSVAMNYSETDDEMNGSKLYKLKVGNRAFAKCKKLTDVMLSKNVVSIGDMVFDGCEVLDAITLPESLEHIGCSVFSETKISSIKIPKNLKSSGKWGNADIGYEGPLANASNLTEVIFEEGVTNIPAYFCAGASCITKAEIPKSVSEIGTEIFYNCENITIYGILNSYAQIYAKENSIPFKVIGGDSEESESDYTLSEQDFIDSHLKFIETDTELYSEYDRMMYYDISDLALENLKGMETSIAAWKILRKDIFDNPYDVVISDLIISQQSADSQIGNFKLNLYKNQRSIINNVMNLIEGKVSLTVSEKSKIEKLFTTKDFSDNETYNLCRKILSQDISDSELQNYFQKYDTTNKFMSLMGDAEKIVNSVIDVINYCSILQAYYDTSKEFKTVLMQVVDRCSYENPLLASSIMDYLTMSDGYDVAESILQKVTGNAISIGIDFFEDTISKKVINYLLKNMALEGVAEKVAENLLAFVKGMKIGAAIGVTINNILFNTDKVADSYVETYACARLATSLRHVLDDNKMLLQKHRDIQYAKLFCETYKMYKNTQMNISEDMIEYVCANYGGLISKIFQQGEKEANLYKWQRRKVYWQTSNCHQEEAEEVVKTDYNSKTFVIACPVDVTLYDKDGFSVLSIINDIITNNSNYVVANIRNGIKYITVQDDDYSIKIFAKNNALMSYAVQSYNMMNLIGAVTFTNINLQKGLTYDGVIPKGKDIDSEQVALKENNIKISSDVYSDLHTGYIEVSNIELDKQEMHLKVNEFGKLDAAILPNNATVNVVTWYSENPDIADIDEYGNVKAISEGQATMVCSSLDGLIKKTAIVNVSDSELVTSILLTAENQTVAAGKTLQLKAEIRPENAENKVLKWSSDNMAVALVDQNGLVTAIGAGQAIIIAESTDGSNISASCIVKVEKSSVSENDQGNNPSGGGSSNGGSFGGGTTGGNPSGGGSSSGSSSSGTTGGNPSGGGSSGENSSSGGTGGNSSGNGTDNSNGNSSGDNNKPDDSMQVKLLYYIIEFNANAGTKLSRKTMTLLNDDNLGILPKVQRENYIFNGWYTQKSGGTKVSSSTVLNAGTTLFAQWTKVDKPSKVKATSFKSKKTGQLVVSFNKITGAKGYEIAYSTNKKFPSSSTKKTVSVSPKKTLKKLKSGKKYYVRVRAYKVDSTGKKVYGAYSKAKGIKVK